MIDVSKKQLSISLDVPLSRISDLLCCAFEGGSNYWYLIKDTKAPLEMSFRSDPDTIFKHLDFPLNPCGGLIITTCFDDEWNGKTEWPLDLPVIERGLRIFVEKCPARFGEFLAENEDANTGDCFLQCCLFGELVYG